MNRRGFTLLEVMFAIALFGMAALALTQALNQIGRAAIDSAESTRRQQLLESRLVEMMHAPLIRAGQEREKVEGETFALETVIEPLQVTNREGRQLSQLFRIRVRAIGAAGEALDELESYRYGPMFSQ